MHMHTRSRKSVCLGWVRNIAGAGWMPAPTNPSSLSTCLNDSVKISDWLCRTSWSIIESSTKTQNISIVTSASCHSIHLVSTRTLCGYRAVKGLAACSRRYSGGRFCCCCLTSPCGSILIAWRNDLPVRSPLLCGLQSWPSWQKCIEFNALVIWPVWTRLTEFVTDCPDAILTVT